MSIGIVIPTRNMAATLDKALASACNQGPEVVAVVDDASEDNTTEVVERYASQFPFVQHIRWREKAPCYVSALRPVYENLGTDHVISLGADDVLLPGLLMAVRRSITRPVVFSHYSCADGDRQWFVRHPYDDVEDLDAEQMRERLRTQQAVETGIGSSVRADVMRRLWALGWDRLGPHSDSIGYATMAAVYGATYVPVVGAHVSFNRKGYGQVQAARDPMGWSQKCADFMSAAGLDAPTMEALIIKRCIGFA